MKTEGEIIKIAISLRECAETLPQTVEKLQSLRLDAMKAGMQRAKKHCSNRKAPEDCQTCLAVAAEAIEADAENLTLEDLNHG